MGDRDQVRRMLAEVPYLQAHPGIRVSEAAKVFGISGKKLLADLDALWMCGLPGGLPDELIDIDIDIDDDRDEPAGTKDEPDRTTGTIRLSNADYLSRPMRFTADEAASLIVALEAVEGLASGSAASAARRAADKIAATLPDTVADQIAISISSGTPDLREQLAQAVEESRQLKLDYDNASRNETTHPVVDPAEIQVREGVAYLCAWSLDRDDWRAFRLDRIVTAEETGAAAAEHGTPPPADDWFTQGAGEVTFDLSAQARWVVEYYPTSATSELPGGGLRATFPVGDPSWVSTMVLRLGAGILRIDPPEAAAAAADLAATALELGEHLPVTNA